jgi:hypothetical protein
VNVFDAPVVRPENQIFAAQLTASLLGNSTTGLNGIYTYDFVEQNLSATGMLIPTDNPRTGAKDVGPYAVEVNNIPIVSLPRYVFLRLRGGVNGLPYYDFVAPASVADSGGSSSYTVTDGTHSDTVSIGIHFNGLVVTSGSGTNNDTVGAAGLTTQVQVNSSGAMAGNASLTFNSASQLIVGDGVGGAVEAGNTVSGVCAGIGNNGGGMAGYFFVGGYGSSSFAYIGYPAANCLAVFQNGLNTYVQIASTTYAVNAEAGAINSAGGYYVGGTAFSSASPGVTGTFLDGSGNTIHVTGGIITALH